MKYSEFKSAIENLGLIYDGNALVTVINPGKRDTLVGVDKYTFANITTYSAIDDLDMDKAEALLRLATELATTPLEERNDEKKYNVVACRHKWGMKGEFELTKFYFRGTSNFLNVAGGDYNGDENQQWTMQQIKDWGLESCERMEAKE